MKHKKCKHGERGSCEKCEKQNTKRCILKPILTDASVLSSIFLEQEQTGQAIDFIEKNREKYVIVSTDLILGEVLYRALEEEKAASGLAKAMEMGKYDGIEKWYLPFGDVGYQGILDTLIKESSLRCGSNDRVHIAFAIFKGIKFATFDDKIEDSVEKINSALEDSGYSGYNLRLYAGFNRKAKKSKGRRG